MLNDETNKILRKPKKKTNSTSHRETTLDVYDMDKEISRGIVLESTSCGPSQHDIG